MPVQPGSKLMAKYGQRLDQAAKQHAMDEPDYGFQRVPAGITKGIARLVQCKFDEYKTGQNKGELYCRMAGVIVEPTEVIVNGSAVDPRGMQTSIMTQVCDRKDAKGVVTKGLNDFVAEIQNNMKIMFAEADQPGIMQLFSTGGAALEQVANLLQQSNTPPNKPIYFYFSTSVRKGQMFFDPATKTQKQGEDGVWENWNGAKGLENYEPPQGGGVVDNSGAGVGEVIPDPNQEPQAPSNEAQQGEADAAGNPMDADGALSELAAQADAVYDEADAEGIAVRDAAIGTLLELAQQAGLTEEQIQSPDVANWAQVVEMIGAASMQPAEPEPAPPPPPVKPIAAKPTAPAKIPILATSPDPVKGKVCKYAVMLAGKPVMDLKLKRPKVAQCEIAVVYSKTKTADLKDLGDGKTIYKSVKWSELKPS